MSSATLVLPDLVTCIKWRAHEAELETPMLMVETACSPLLYMFM